jgi:hypothetical protein
MSIRPAMKRAVSNCVSVQSLRMVRLDVFDQLMNSYPPFGPLEATFRRQLR